jgi:hypothetical protein
MRPGVMSVCVVRGVLCFAVVAVLATSCDGSRSTPPTGTLAAVLPAGLAGDVGLVRIDVSQNGKLVASQSVSATSLGTSLSGAAGGPAPRAVDGGTAPLGDAFFVLAPGMYTVVATPLTAAGGPSQLCVPATTQAQVEPSLTTEVTLVILCQSPGNGGLDVTVTTNSGPTIIGLTFAPNKYTEPCEPVTVSVTASDSSGGALTYVWSVTAEPAGAPGPLPPGVASNLTPTGSTAVFDTTVAGDYTLEVLVTNATGQTASLSFPIHVLTGAQCSGAQPLTGYLVPLTRATPVIGPVPADTDVSLSLGLSVSDPAGLQAFVKAVADPKDPNYRQFLTPKQFAATYGASAADYQTLQDWATGNGLTIAATYPNNLLLGVTGPAAKIEQALFVNLVYRRRGDGNQFIAVDREPSLNLAIPILHISGLTDDVPPSAGLTPNGTGSGGFYRAADIRAAYLGVGASSSCQSLDGSGQVVGIATFAPFDQNDVVGYDGLQVPAINPSNVTVAATEGGDFITAGFTLETTMDVEMVQAMAPGARVHVFEGSMGITFHADDIFHAMATASPPLTSASCSWVFGRSDNAQQALSEMAAQGTSFFTSSGDFGDVGDPQSNKDMSSLTLVGGTILSTNTLVSGDYPASYYAGDFTWNDVQGNQQKDVTGGGIMDGNNRFGPSPPFPGCICIPWPLCCGSSVPIPDYQKGVSMATNGGSTAFRNYPDVALLAENIEIFFGGGTIGSGGTSAAAPLWAGFTALLNQRGARSGIGPAGFLNPAIYDIGLTSGTANDLYHTCFHDVTDGVSNANGFGSGFVSVPGYDLTTGWGTPTCGLINQLSTIAPLSPNTPLSLIEFTIVTGQDDLGGGLNGSGAHATVILPGGQTFTETLKTAQEASWDNGSTHILDFAIPMCTLTITTNCASQPLTGTNGISGVTLTLDQNNPSFSADNWDIADVEVTLFNPQSAKVCQIDLVGNNTLQDGHVGLERLSLTADLTKGDGPTSRVFSTGVNSGCF